MPGRDPELMHNRVTKAAPNSGAETIGVGGLGFFEISLVLVRFDHIASRIVGS